MLDTVDLVEEPGFNMIFIHFDIVLVQLSISLSNLYFNVLDLIRKKLESLH